MLEPLVPQSLPGPLATGEALDELIGVNRLGDRLPAKELVGAGRKRRITLEELVDVVEVTGLASLHELAHFLRPDLGNAVHLDHVPAAVEVAVLGQERTTNAAVPHHLVGGDVDLDAPSVRGPEWPDVLDEGGAA